jgi:hypothetical protein
MQTQEIPPERWPEFFNQFSRDHEGWLATIEILDRQAGPQAEAQWQPLQGISLDTKGTQPSSVTISVGDPSGLYIRHMVEMPLHIRQATGLQGTDVDLQIEPATGPQTLLHVRGPIH